MIKQLLACVSFLSSVVILCTGFIVSALESVQKAINNNNSGAFRYSLFDLSIWWIIIPVLLIIIGVVLLISSKKQ